MGDAMAVLRRHADVLAGGLLVVATLLYAALYVDFNVPRLKMRRC